MSSTPDRPLSVTVWNEGRHEKQDASVIALYPRGIHAAIAEGLIENLGAGHPPVRQCAVPARGGPRGRLLRGVQPLVELVSGDAATAAVFEMSEGTRYAHHGSWCSPGAETSWEGRWRVSGSLGTAVWDGDTAPLLDISESTGEPVALTATPPPGHGIEGSLADFVSALRSGVAPMGEVHDNLMSLAMVYGAVASAGTGRRTRIEDVLTEAGR